MSYRPQATYSEHDLLTVLARTAEATPDAYFAFVQGPPVDPAGPNTTAFAPVTYSQTLRIVNRLAEIWESRLRDQYSIPIKPGNTAISIVTLPAVHSLFHLFAFWALGITVQYLDHEFDARTLAKVLIAGKSNLILHSGLDERCIAMLADVQRSNGIPSFELPPEEYAYELLSQVSSSDSRWKDIPTPPVRIPDPSIVSHSSASTGDPKVIRYSLEYWCYDIVNHSKEVLSQGATEDQRNTRPRLLISRPFYNTYVGFFVLHLISARPLAFAHPQSRVSPSAVEILEALVHLNAGEVATYVEQAREMVLRASKPDKLKWLDALRSLNQFAVSGAGVDTHLSKLVDENGIKALNIFGISDTGGMLVGPSPQLHVLYPIPSQKHHLFLPMEPAETNKSNGIHVEEDRDVQFWSLISAWPRLQHVVQYGGATVKAEPYPGPGEHHGEPAINWGDLFRPVKPKGPDGPTGYIHLGRSDDLLRHTNNRGTPALAVEANLLHQARERLDFEAVTNVQIFGANLPGSAVVFQVADDVGTKDDGVLLSALEDSIKATASALSLPDYSYPRSMEFVRIVRHNDGGPNLLITHKGNLRRRNNTSTFQSWLDALPWHA